MHTYRWKKNSFSRSFSICFVCVPVYNEHTLRDTFRVCVCDWCEWNNAQIIQSKGGTERKLSVKQVFREINGCFCCCCCRCRRRRCCSSHSRRSTSLNRKKATVKQTVPNIHSEKKFPVIKFIHVAYFLFSSVSLLPFEHSRWADIVHRRTITIFWRWGYDEDDDGGDDRRSSCGGTSIHEDHEKEDGTQIYWVRLQSTSQSRLERSFNDHFLG